MPMRRAISISLACLVTSACATSEILEESKSNDPVGTPTSIAEESAETPADHPRSRPCAAAEERRSPDSRSKRAEQRLASLGCGSIADPVRTVGRSQFGKAVWYDHVGRPTASGEILDTVTATDEPRQRPLGRRQNKRPRPVHSRSHPRPFSACCRPARHEGSRGGGGRRRTVG